MLAQDIIQEFNSRNLTIAMSGDGGLRVTPASQLTDGDRQTIRQYKADLLAFLASQPDPCPACAGALTLEQGEYWKHTYCSSPGHFDSWKTTDGRSLKEAGAPIWTASANIAGAPQPPTAGIQSG